MPDISPSRSNIAVAGAQYLSAVSEGLIQKLGSSINFINDYQHSEKQFFLNGRYNSLVLPFLGVDGLAVFGFNAEIINVYMFVLEAGSGGTTELDLKVATSSGGAFTSVFSTTPKIASTAGNFAYVGIGGSGTGLTAPVFTTLNANGFFSVAAGSAIRFDIVTAQTGNPRSCGLLCHYRPR